MRGSEVVLAAPAKLNLRLEVDPPGPDGYHPIRSLMVALPGLADEVRLRAAARRAVRCPGVPERENLAWRALTVLEERVGRALPLEVAIAKRIPARAGLGGGSSDAAATLLGANRLLGLGLGHDELELLAAAVGSDVPFFVRGGARWATGRGERLAPVRVPSLWAVLARPVAGLTTGAVYRAFDRLAPPPRDTTPVPATARALVGWCRNDLWPAALALRPALGAVARALTAAGAEGVLLAGSGSTVAGLATAGERARAVAEAVRAARPDLWVAVSPTAPGHGAAQ